MTFYSIIFHHFSACTFKRQYGLNVKMNRFKLINLCSKYCLSFKIENNNLCWLAFKIFFKSLARKCKVTSITFYFLKTIFFFTAQTNSNTFISFLMTWGTSFTEVCWCWSVVAIAKELRGGTISFPFIKDAPVYPRLMEIRKNALKLLS